MILKCHLVSVPEPNDENVIGDTEDTAETFQDLELFSLADLRRDVETLRKSEILIPTEGSSKCCQASGIFCQLALVEAVSCINDGEETGS